MLQEEERQVRRLPASVRIVTRRRFRTFLGRTVLGTLLPGAGLLLSGHVVTGGLILAGFVALVVGVTGYLAYVGPTRGALALAVDSTTLLAVALLTVLVVLVWLISVLWTAEITWPRPAGRAKRVGAVVTVAVLCAALIAPTVRGVQTVFVQRDLLGVLFEPADPGRRGAVPDIGGDDPWRSYPHVNVLLVGSDAEPDRPGTRTDSMMLASIETATGDTTLFGLPRNLQRIPLPSWSPLRQVWSGGYDCASECLLNEVWDEGVRNAHLYPGDPRPGLTALREAVSEITGLTPDYSVVVDMASFQAFVNAMGGVQINVRERVPIGGKVHNGDVVPGSITGWIEPGPQLLDGYHAMWFARGRATTDDFDRMKRQRCMVGALVDQVNPRTMIERYPDIAAVAKDNIYTDVPQEHLSAWAVLVTRMQDGQIRSLPFSDKVIDVTDPDYDHLRAYIQAAIHDAPLPGETAATDGATRGPSRGPATPGTPTAPTEGLVDVAAVC